MRSKERTFADGARRAQIVGCAIEVVAELGYGQASVRKIAQRVGVAMSVVLYHFATKDELIEAVVAEVYRSVIATIRPAVAAEPTAAGQLRAYIRAHLAFVAAHRGQHVALADIWANHRSASGARQDDLGIDAEIAAGLAALDLAAIFRRGQRNGEFRAFPPPSMATALRGALGGVVAEVLRDPDFDVEGYGEELVTAFDLATRSAS
jgi:AcrR family transcriptional regulator